MQTDDNWDEDERDPSLEPKPEGPRAEEMVKYRDEVGMFAPNPSGELGKIGTRKQRDYSNIKSLAKPYTNEAFVAILDIMRDKANKSNIRLHAAETVLAYGWGRPAALQWADDSPTNPLNGFNTRELQIMLVRAIQEPSNTIDVTPEDDD